MIRHLLSLLAYVLSCLLFVCAAGLFLCVLGLISSQVALALHLTPLALELTRALPAWFAWTGVVASPLGGVFRTDLFILGVLALVVARILRRLAKGLA